MRIGILGSGSWGTAIAVLLSYNSSSVILHSYNKQKVAQINKDKSSPIFPDVNLGQNIRATSQIQEIAQCDFVFLALPVQSTDTVIRQLREYDPHNKCFVVCNKGIDCKSLLFVSEIIETLLPKNNVAVLSGPNFANEVICGNYSASTIACKNYNLASEVQSLIQSEKFSTSITDDIISVQVAGSLKNIIAIICGMLKTKKYENNTIAAIMTMGLKEMVKFATAKGGKAETFLDYCGVGDLSLTCYSENSRNVKFGMSYAAGLTDLKQLVEGFYTTKSAFELAKKLDIKKIPVFEAAYRILYENKNLEDVLKVLFGSANA